MARELPVGQLANGPRQRLKAFLGAYGPSVRQTSKPFLAADRLTRRYAAGRGCAKLSNGRQGSQLVGSAAKRRVPSIGGVWGLRLQLGRDSWLRPRKPLEAEGEPIRIHNW